MNGCFGFNVRFVAAISPDKSTSEITEKTFTKMPGQI